jgi:hypothetical protein
MQVARANRVPPLSHPHAPGCPPADAGHTASRQQPKSCQKPPVERKRGNARASRGAGAHPCRSDHHRRHPRRPDERGRIRARCPIVPANRLPNFTDTVHACADLTGAHLFHLQSRCHRGQEAIVWPELRVWGHVGPGTELNAARDGGRAEARHQAAQMVAGGDPIGFRAHHEGPGRYGITVTDPVCGTGFGPITRRLNPIITLSDSSPPDPIMGNPPIIPPPGSFPVAWFVYGGEPGDDLTVFTGLVQNGEFTPKDRGLGVEAPC